MFYDIIIVNFSKFDVNLDVKVSMDADRQIEIVIFSPEVNVHFKMYVN